MCGRSGAIWTFASSSKARSSARGSVPRNGSSQRHDDWRPCVSNRWERPAADVFAVQTEIAEQVIGQFEMLTGPVKAPDVTAAKRKRPESLTA